MFVRYRLTPLIAFRFYDPDCATTLLRPQDLIFLTVYDFETWLNSFSIPTVHGLQFLRFTTVLTTVGTEVLVDVRQATVKTQENPATESLA